MSPRGRAQRPAIASSARYRIALTFQGKHGLIVLDQMRTLDRVRLVRRLGALCLATLAATLQTLQAMLVP